MSKEWIENYIKILKEWDGKENYYEGVYFQEEIERYNWHFNFCLEFYKRKIKT